MRKFLIILGVLFIGCSNVFAAKIPDIVKSYILEKVPQADIRFDGVIIFPDNTIYLPLYPSLFSDITTLKIKETYPYGMNEKEWNQLSIKDKAAIRRDFYFYEKGSTSFVNPKLEIEGRQDSSQSVFLKQEPKHPQ